MKEVKLKKGMTLIESLVYLALFGLIFATIMQFVIFITDYNKNAAANTQLEKETIFISEHLNDSFSKASSVDEVVTTYQNNNGVLRLNTESGFIEYSLSGGRINFFSTNNFFISSNLFSVSRFYLEKIIDQNNTTIGIRVSIDINYIKDSKVSKTIETAYLLK